MTGIMIAIVGLTVIVVVHILRFIDIERRLTELETKERHHDHSTP